MVNSIYMKVYIILGIPVDQRQIADFRGTITYASLNAHNKIVKNLFTNFS